MLTGVRTRWDKFRVFGCDCYRQVPNDRYAKVPGIVRGQKLIFVGFHPTINGYRVFDPEARRYFSTDNMYFYESFAHRIDALRHHDSRRKLLREGHEQPVQINDFDDENAHGVRNLFLHPDASVPPSFEGAAGSSDPGVVETVASEGAAESPSQSLVTGDGVLREQSESAGLSGAGQ